jgi:hypothetical protein
MTIKAKAFRRQKLKALSLKLKDTDASRGDLKALRRVFFFWL